MLFTFAFDSLPTDLKLLILFSIDLVELDEMVPRLVGTYTQ